MTALSAHGVHDVVSRELEIRFEFLQFIYANVLCMCTVGPLQWYIRKSTIPRQRLS